MKFMYDEVDKEEVPFSFDEEKNTKKEPLIGIKSYFRKFTKLMP